MSDASPQPKPASPVTGRVSGRIDAWLARDGLVAGSIFAIALVLRLLHLSEIAANDPFYELASVDGSIYDTWAREILGGDLIGEGVLFLGPLYPMFMAFVYSLFGPSLPALKLVQAIIGSGACVLVWGLTRDLFDRRAAALAGGALAFYDMHIFYGGTLMIVNLQVPLVVGLVWSAVRALRRPSFTGWALCGLLLGLSALARQTTLLMAPILALFLLFGMEGDASFGRRFAWGSTFGVVILALILPFTIRNYVVADDFVLLNSTGGANFYMGNQRHADGSWQVPSIDWPSRVDNPKAMRDAFTGVAERELGRKLKASEVSAYWMGRGLDEIREAPGRWVALELRKAALFVNVFEIWNNRSIEVSKSFSRVLRAPLISFGVIGPLGLLGLLLTARRYRELVPIHAALFAYLFAALLFFVLSRYRLPAVVLLFPFAAHALLHLVDQARAGRYAKLAGQIVLLVLLAVFVHLPLVNENRMHMAWYNLGNKYRELERWEEAIAAYRTSLEENGRAISTHNNLAIALEGAGRRLEAIATWRRVHMMAKQIGSERHARRARNHLAALTGSGAAKPADRGDAPVESSDAAPR